MADTGTLPSILSSRNLGVTLAGASLSHAGQPLFEDLGMHLEPGRVTCLLGPSGVGKSSLLRTFAGLPGGAVARIACDDGLPLAGRVAWLDQRDSLLPWLSALDNVLLGSRLRGERPDRPRALELLARVGLRDAAPLRPAALSGGMRQRVALARTLMEDRPVLLLDEPFSALDAITRFRLQGLAAELFLGRTVLLVTHDPAEALRLGQNLHVMAGRPATLAPALVPPGEPPRDPADPVLRPLQRDLMQRLLAAAGRA